MLEEFVALQTAQGLVSRMRHVGFEGERSFESTELVMGLALEPESSNLHATLHSKPQTMESDTPSLNKLA